MTILLCPLSLAIHRLAGSGGMARKKKGKSDKEQNKSSGDSKKSKKTPLKELLQSLPKKEEPEQKEELIKITTIQSGSPKPPTKAQQKKFKVPDTDLQEDDKAVNIYAKLKDIKSSDISFALSQDSLIILGKNRKAAYYTDIKLPEPIIPQSAVVKFMNGTLNFNIQKLNKNDSWDGVPKTDHLDKELTETKERLTKFQEQYHAIQLEYQDILVKSKKEVENKVDIFRLSVIERLIQSIDNFQLALNSASDKKNKNKDQVLVGINMILNDLQNMIKDEGVTEIPTKDMLLDPNMHEVVECKETDKHPENTILEEFQKGYQYKERIIRPSKVKVAVAPKKKGKGKGKKKK